MQGRRCLIASLRGEEETSLLLHLASRVHKYYHEHPAETQCTVFKFQGSGFGLRSSEDRLHTITRQEKYAIRDGLLPALDPAARHIGAGAYLLHYFAYAALTRRREAGGCIQQAYYAPRTSHLAAGDLPALPGESLHFRRPSWHMSYLHETCNVQRAYSLV